MTGGPFVDYLNGLRILRTNENGPGAVATASIVRPCVGSGAVPQFSPGCESKTRRLVFARARLRNNNYNVFSVCFFFLFLRHCSVFYISVYVDSTTF